MVAFTVNGERKEVELDPDTPLLWALREHLGLARPASRHAAPAAVPSRHPLAVG